MTNNDVLRSIRYMLDLSEPKMVELLLFADVAIEREDIKDFLRNEEDEQYLACDDDLMIAFLNGLVIFKRGKNENAANEAAPVEKMSNNLVLKKLRIAFELKEETMHEVFANADYRISKPELSAFFRKKGHDNYRACGDQVLRYFLKGLTIRLRGQIHT